MRTKQGVVTSSKQDKTAVVTVHSYKNHPKYKKRFRVSSKFYVHDPKNELQTGDMVIIQETKPESKLKRWKIVEKLGNVDLSTVEMETKSVEPSQEPKETSQEK